MPVGKDQVTVVVPTLNEEKAIGLMIKELKTECYANILVIDGYSTDRTTRIAKENEANVISQYGRGKAGAIRTAIDMVKTPYMLVMDADYTYEPKDI